MTSALTAPAASAGAEKHADWLELSALAARDRNSSFQDLARVLRAGGTADALGNEDRVASEIDTRSEETEAVTGDAFTELDVRLKSCGGKPRYPFGIDEGFIQAVRRPDLSTYTFLLLLSQYGKDAGPVDLNGERLFEDVCAAALLSYLGGEAVGARVAQFGFPRRIEPPGFEEALDKLCADLGEGGGSKARPTRSDQKDAKLDLVAWRAFPDGRLGKLIVFAQCATGDDWPDKLTEMQPQAFCWNWMHELPPVLPSRAFFAPHRIAEKRWDVSTGSGGILFDRCRISMHAPQLGAPLRADCSRWSRHVIKEKLRP